MRPSVLLIGNFLSNVAGVKSVSEEIAEQLRDSSDWRVRTTSSHQGRVRRFLDIFISVVIYQSTYEIVNIEVYSGLAFIWAEASAQMLRWLHKPFILALHGGGLPLLAERYPNRVRRLLRIADAVTTPSHYIKQAFLPFRDDIIYLPNGLNLETYPFKLRANPGPNLCWLRAFHEIYAPSMAVEVVARLRKSFPNVRLAMIGPDKKDGSYEQVQKIIRKNGLEDCVDFIGGISKKEIPIWLNKYDVFINTTTLESFGVAVMEAGAIGLPIVTTDVGELPYLWCNEEDALLVPANDAAAMENAVRRILNEPGLAGKLSRNARQNAMKFDWSAILLQWQSLIADVLEKRIR